MKAPSDDFAADQPGQDLAPDQPGQDLELEAKIDETAYILLTQNVAINPALSTFFSRRKVYDGVSAISPLTFAPGLAGVLSASKPPNAKFFRSLPDVLFLNVKTWGVYAIL